MPCILNAAGEVTNLAFREGRIGFMDIPAIIEKTMAAATFEPAPTLDCLFDTDREARRIAENFIA